MIPLFAALLLTMPLHTFEHEGTKLDEYSDYAKVTFKSGKVVFYHIQAGTLVKIDPVTETISIEEID